MSALFLLTGLQLGGSEAKTVKIVNELAGRGRRVSLAYLQGPEHLLHEISDSVTTTCLQRKGKFSIRALKNLRRFVTDQDIDVIVCMNEYPLLYAAALRLSSAHGNVRVVLATNTTEFERRRDKLFMLLYSRLIRRIDGVIYGCEYQMRLWQKRYRLARVDSRVIYNGVSLEDFDRNRIDDDLRTEFALNDSFVIGCVGRLDREKNQTALLTVASRLGSASRRCDVLLVGAGPVRETLQRQARDLGIEDRVHFTGRMSDVRAALKSMDVFVLPSVAVETFSNAALEAMAMSVPAILSSIAGAPEMIVDGETGYLYEKNDLDRLSDLLIMLRDNEDLRTKVGHSARESVERRFSIERMFDAYDSLLSGG
jgi:glycosyltransferase involved in cell wall biosynthesis